MHKYVITIILNLLLLTNIIILNLVRDTHEAQLPDILPSVQKGIPANANMMFDTM